MKTCTLAAAALLACTPAMAQPPPVGWIGALSDPSILCDTSAQLESIVAAFGEGRDQGIAKFGELFATMNTRSEPTCAVTAVPVAVASDKTELGVLRIGGSDVYGWILRIRNRAGEGYYLYLESPAEALRNTI